MGRRRSRGSQVKVEDAVERILDLGRRFQSVSVWQNSAAGNLVE
jgi:hypothetical protein